MLSEPPTIDSASWRPATVDDAAAVSALQQACFAADGGYRLTTEEFRNELADPEISLPDDTLLALDDAGRAVAFVLVKVRSSFDDRMQIFGWDFVVPGHRGHGIEDFLLEWYEARGRERAVEIDPGLPGLLRTAAYDWQHDRIERLDAHGYEPIRYFVELVTNLSQPIEPTVLPEGYAFEAWPDDSDAIRVLHNEVFEDHWGTEARSPDEWERYFLDEFFRVDLSFIVVGEGVPVAYLQSSAYPHDFEDRGRSEAWVETLGTARDHRRRGLASVLINRALREYQSAGFEFAAIGVDSESPTGALRLYEALGFEAEKRSISFGKVLV